MPTGKGGLTAAAVLLFVVAAMFATMTYILLTLLTDWRWSISWNDPLGLFLWGTSASAAVASIAGAIACLAMRPLARGIANQELERQEFARQERAKLKLERQERSRQEREELERARRERVSREREQQERERHERESETDAAEAG